MRRRAKRVLACTGLPCRGHTWGCDVQSQTTQRALTFKMLMKDLVYHLALAFGHLSAIVCSIAFRGVAASQTSHDAPKVSHKQAKFCWIGMWNATRVARQSVLIMHYTCDLQKAIAMCFGGLRFGKRAGVPAGTVMRPCGRACVQQSFPPRRALQR